MGVNETTIRLLTLFTTTQFMICMYINHTKVLMKTFEMGYSGEIKMYYRLTQLDEKSQVFGAQKDCL